MSPSLWVQHGSVALDHESKFKEILAISITFTTLMAAIVSLRAYVRIVMLKSLGADDFAIFAGALCNVAYTGLCIGQTRYGLGLSTPSRPEEDLDQFGVLNYGGRPIYIASILSFKIALCLSYLRIILHSSARYRQLVWFVLITCLLAHIAGILMLIFACTPIEKGWKLAHPGTCIPIANTVYVGSVTSIFYDIVILLLPVPLIVKLQINERKKYGLLGIFLLGLFTTLCSIMRLVQVESILHDGNVTGLITWATVEMNVGVSLTCMPTLLPLFKSFHEKVTCASSSGGGRSFKLRSHHGGTAFKVSSRDTSQGWESVDDESRSGDDDLERRDRMDPSMKGIGIMATTEIDVRSSYAVEMEAGTATGGRW